MPQFDDLPGGGSYQDNAGGYDGGSYGGQELASLKDRWIAAGIDYWVPFWGFLIPNWLFDGSVDLVTVLFIVWLNSAVVQGITGRSLGKFLTGTQLAMAVVDRDGAQWAVYPGVKQCTIRLLLHVKDVYTFGQEIFRSVDRQTRADQDSSTFVFKETFTLERRPRHFRKINPR